MLRTLVVMHRFKKKNKKNILILYRFIFLSVFTTHWWALILAKFIKHSKNTGHVLNFSRVKIIYFTKLSSQHNFFESSSYFMHSQFRIKEKNNPSFYCMEVLFLKINSVFVMLLLSIFCFYSIIYSQFVLLFLVLL